MRERGRKNERQKKKFQKREKKKNSPAQPFESPFTEKSKKKRKKKTHCPQRPPVIFLHIILIKVMETGASTEGHGTSSETRHKETIQIFPPSIQRTALPPALYRPSTQLLQMTIEMRRDLARGKLHLIKVFLRRFEVLRGSIAQSGSQDTKRPSRLTAL